MFGKKKSAPAPPSRKGAGLMQQMGYGGGTDMSAVDEMVYGDSDDDEDLEAELLALQGEEPQTRKAKKKGNFFNVDFGMLDKMIAEGMQDIPSDEELSDTEDSDLMTELEEIALDGQQFSAPTPTISSSSSQKVDTSILEERIAMYMQASENASSAGDTSKKRRIDRGVKANFTIVKSDKTHKMVCLTVNYNRTNHVPATFVTSMYPSNERPPVLGDHLSMAEGVVSQVRFYCTSKSRMLTERRDQYKHAALTAKRNKDIHSATQFVKVAKQFDSVITALEAGKEIDLSKMPPAPNADYVPQSEVPVAVPVLTPTQRSAVQAAGNTQPATEKEPDIPQGLSEKEEKEFFKAPDAPKTVMDALQQRLEKYKQSEDSAKVAGESGKARRMGRIVKQYQDAIKFHKAGKSIDYDELPTPPGFAPIPVRAQGPSAPHQSSSGGATGTASHMSPGAVSSHSSTSSQSLSPSPDKGHRLPLPGARSPGGQITPTKPVPAPRQSVSPQSTSVHQQQKTASMKKSPSSRAEQQAVFLRERMEEYKMAALQAKKNRDLELAKKYMRLAKGFQPMIDAADSGLPVDLAQIPPSLNAKENETAFVVVTPDEVQITGDRDEVFKKLEQDLIQQIRTCATNNQNFTKLGDVVTAMKFQQMEKNSRKDLESLKSAFRSGDPVPEFHYENRTFSLVQCNADLGDNDFELSIVRGIQYNLPSGYAEKDVDTYVKFDFPYPTDDPQTGTTETIKSSLNPEYQQPFKIEISRKSRGFMRVVERKIIKIEIFYKRGFLKSDKIIGVVNLKLQALDNKCTVHDSYDLTDGKKAVGGKLEVKMRIRDPVKGRQIEEVKEKWLVMDKFIKVKRSTVSYWGKTYTKLWGFYFSDGSSCMEVLKFERQQLDRQISCLKDSLSPSQTQSLRNKSKLLQDKLDQKQSMLKVGGITQWKFYVSEIEAEIPDYDAEARHLAQQGDIQKAQIILTKKKMAEKELAAIRAKIGNV
ncbi:hypothetical protein ScPMuIL_001626 [Solemya velum]